MYDVIIIGAGVIGCAAARELSRLEARILVIERDSDVCEGTSKANSAIVHSGYDAKNGTLKARFNVRGNAMMDELCRELDVPFKRIGSLTVCTSEDDIPKLRELKERGERNGVDGLRIVYRDELLAMEPNIADGVVAALYAPSAGIICPFKLTAALAENACHNGAEFRFDTRVTDIRRTSEGYWCVTASDGEYISRALVNAAGVYADELNNMVSSRKLRIIPRRGDYMLLDRSVEGYVRHTVFQLPTDMGKGVLVTPTVHGNTIIGPTAFDTEDKENTATTAEALSEIADKSAISIKALPLRQVITSFSGLRAREQGRDFVIGEAEGADGFYNCAGIQSPGLSAAPAIAEYIADLIKTKLSFSKKADFDPVRKDIVRPFELSADEYNELIRREPAYGTVVCRCESVTEGEIIDAIRRTPGARTLDGVKRRTRAGMGRCQSGFCCPKVMDILVRELGIATEDVTKRGGDSHIVVGRTKEV